MTSTSMMKLTCMFSFILLFGAAGLLVFIHLQDPEEVIHQQSLGKSFLILSLPPLGSQEGQWPSPRDSPTRMGGSWDPLSGTEVHPARTHKRRRRFVIKKSVIPAAASDSFLKGSAVESEERRDVKWRGLYETQRERKRIMRETCVKYRSNSKRIITPYHVSRIFVEDKYRILYCEVPKAGCSNWKRVLMVLGGLAPSTKVLQHNTVHYGNYLKRLDGFDRKGINRRLSTYTKMLFVREPFEKLVSAFRDKFEHPNTYYHPVFGRPIISKYRLNATKEALRTGAGVTFHEFIQYLLDVHRPMGMDIHWDHVNRLCSPCLIDYDFIGKFESMEEDANFFLHLINAPQNLTFPRFKDRHSDEERTTTQIMQQYFTQLSPSQRQRSYDFYYMDYMMFNYSKPFEDLY
uniref:Carbohydrate sulfotransferase n=1 Tax=Varanus komodoensis TaxID=61221 RepID=A0A8D2JAC4_VARKO